MTLLVLFNFFWKYFNACKIIIFYEYIIINLTIFLLLDILVLPWTSFFFSMNIFIHTVWTAASVCPQSRLTLCNLMTVAHEAPHPWNSPGKNTVVLGRHFLLQGFFPTQELNLCLLCLLHCRQILYHWAIGEAQNGILSSLKKEGSSDSQHGWISRTLCSVRLASHNRTSTV